MRLVDGRDSFLLLLLTMATPCNVGSTGLSLGTTLGFMLIGIANEPGLNELGKDAVMSGRGREGGRGGGRRCLHRCFHLFLFRTEHHMIQNNITKPNLNTR